MLFQELVVNVYKRTENINLFVQLIPLEAHNKAITARKAMDIAAPDVGVTEPQADRCLGEILKKSV